MSELNRRYLLLQQEFHPDGYAKKSDAEQRLAVQMAALINQAFETLKSPLHRAQYLLERTGISADEQSKTTSDGAFLMQQIEKNSKSKVCIPSNELIDYKEAMIFGFLGLLRFLGVNNCFSSVTGSSRDHSCGFIFENK